MRTLIIDDEATARSRLERLLRAHPDIEIQGEATNGEEALQMILRINPQVVFLDVQMPGLDGFGVLRGIPASCPSPLAIFTTGYDEYALRAFEANALSYILKPVSADRLASAVGRARQILASTTLHASAIRAGQRAAKEGIQLVRLVCRKRSEAFLIDPCEVLWFYMDGGLVRARTAKDSYLVNHHLNYLEESLGPRGFFKARRTHLVNLTHVLSVKAIGRSSFSLVMKNSENSEIAVSERQARDLRSRLPGL